MKNKGMQCTTALSHCARSKLIPHAAILPLIVLHLAFMQPLAALQQHRAEESQHPLSTHPHLELCNPSNHQGSPTHGPLPWFCTSNVHALPFSRRAGPRTVAPKHSSALESPISMEHEAETPDQNDITHQASLNAYSQCTYCPVYSELAYPYETPAIATPRWPGDCSCTTGGAVGGKSFAVHQPKASSVAILEGWRYPPSPFPMPSNGGIQALRVVFINGTGSTIGTIPQQLDYEHRSSVILFQPNETIDGFITVRTDPGYWSVREHVSYIHFRTNMGQTFEVGDMDPDPNQPYPNQWVQYEFDADGRTLTGLFGTAGWNVDQIGFLVGKEIWSEVQEDN